MSKRKEQKLSVCQTCLAIEGRFSHLPLEDRGLVWNKFMMAVVAQSNLYFFSPVLIWGLRASQPA